MKQLVAFVGVMTLSLSVAFADKYAMKDLKALIAQKGYQEVLQHLDDIAPSDRNQDWIDVAGQAAAGYLATAEDGEKLQLMVQAEKQYPTIIKSTAYLKARLDAVPKAFGKCYSEAGSSYGGQDERLAGYDKCIAIAKKFIESEPTNAALALALAKAPAKTSYPHKALGLFKIAITMAGKSSATVCKEPDLAGGVVNSWHFAGGKALEETNDVATICWASVKAPVFAELKKKDVSETFQINACALASAQKDYGKDDAATCAGVPKPKK
jgi:hypothetical protein